MKYASPALDRFSTELIPNSENDFGKVKLLGDETRLVLAQHGLGYVSVSFIPQGLTAKVVISAYNKSDLNEAKDLLTDVNAGGSVRDSVREQVVQSRVHTLG